MSNKFKLCLGTAFYNEVPEVKKILAESDLIITTDSVAELVRDIPGKTIIQVTGSAESLVDPKNTVALLGVCAHVFNEDNTQPLTWDDLEVHSYLEFNEMYEAQGAAV